jgi:hypothetical protein
MDTDGDINRSLAVVVGEAFGRGLNSSLPSASDVSACELGGLTRSVTPGGGRLRRSPTASFPLVKDHHPGPRLGHCALEEAEAALEGQFPSAARRCSTGSLALDGRPCSPSGSRVGGIQHPTVVRGPEPGWARGHPRGPRDRLRTGQPSRWHLHSPGPRSSTRTRTDLKSA